MLALPGTLTIKMKSINSNWFITGLTGSPPTDSETHIALVTCYNTWTDVRQRQTYRCSTCHDVWNRERKYISITKKRQTWATLETITQHAFLVFHYHSLQDSSKTRIVFSPRTISDWNWLSQLNSFESIGWNITSCCLLYQVLIYKNFN
jgi:hypothetical protein